MSTSFYLWQWLLRPSSAPFATTCIWSKLGKTRGERPCPKQRTLNSFNCWVLVTAFKKFFYCCICIYVFTYTYIYIYIDIIYIPRASSTGSKTPASGGRGRAATLIILGVLADRLFRPFSYNTKDYTKSRTNFTRRITRRIKKKYDKLSKAFKRLY